MAVIIIILLCVTVLAFVLWGVICAAILRFSHRLKNLNGKEWVKTVLACAKEFTESGGQELSYTHYTPINTIIFPRESLSKCSLN